MLKKLVLSRDLRGNSQMLRYFSSKYKILISRDEDCFVSHHPDAEHPYEHTKPLPQEQLANNTILAEDSKNMIVTSPNLEQLQALTFTPTRYWHQYPGKLKRQRYKEWFDDKVDRPGLTS